MSLLAPLQCQGLQHYYCGYPIHVAVEIRLLEASEAPPGGPIPVDLEELPRLELFSPSMSLGFELRDASGSVVSRAPARSGAIEPEGQASYVLSAGERRRVLVELSERLPSLSAGDYQLRLQYEADSECCEAEPLQLRLHELTAERLSELGAPTIGTHWSRWSLARATAGYPFDMVEAEDPARFNRIIKELIHGPRPLADIEPQRLAALAGLYAPERDALLVELAVARGDRAGAEVLASEVEARSPGMRWWLREALDECGPITSSRNFLEKLR